MPRLAGLSLSLIFLAHPVLAQTAILRGSVADSSGAVIPGAKVSATAARDGKEAEARTQIRLTLQARQATLSTTVSRLLVQNNENEQQAAAQVRGLTNSLTHTIGGMFQGAATLIMSTDGG